jgi:hypothetical protein
MAADDYGELSVLQDLQSLKKTVAFVIGMSVDLRGMSLLSMRPVTRGNCGTWSWHHPDNEWLPLH